MTIAESLLAEFENEARTTRKFLERLPDDKLTWKPHEKSMSAGQLALHMAVVPGNVVQMAKQDVIPVPECDRQRPEPKSTREVLDALDASIAKVKEVLPTFTDAQMQALWRIRRGDKDVLAIPRAGMIRNILLNH